MDKTGYSLSKGVETVCKSLSADFLPDVRPLTLSGANAQYLRDFCAQAQSIGTDVLFLRTPHRTQTTDPNVFNDAVPPTCWVGESAVTSCGNSFSISFSSRFRASYSKSSSSGAS